MTETGGDAFEGAWRVTEHVFDPATRRHLGDVQQDRLLHRQPNGNLQVTQICRPGAGLAEHPMAGFAGTWVFELALEGSKRRYLGPDVMGEGSQWRPGAMTGVGRWPRFGFDFTSWSALVAPGRQLTGGTFSANGEPMAVIVGVAEELATGADPAEWPALDVSQTTDGYGPWLPLPNGGRATDTSTGTVVTFMATDNRVDVTIQPLEHF